MIFLWARGKEALYLKRKTWDSRRGSFPCAGRSLEALVITVSPPPSRIHSARPIEWRGGGAGLGVLVFSFGCGQICGDFSYRCSGCWSLVGVFKTWQFYTLAFLILFFHAANTFGTIELFFMYNLTLQKFIIIIIIFNSAFSLLSKQM